ncbi:hypothetical protein [Fibrobacter sp. UBA4297]|uniref:hypothetical protein n=1 Tax=Fibrobacter sp. UBA4297 TaxID=1946536 RepID=UPI0025BFB0BF|nr:hypothetical protein [Fibrobacter sp. UBA4297]
MKSLITAISFVLSASAFAANSALSDFERSLLNDNSAAKNESSAVSDSSGSFEQSLMNESGSEMEPIYRAREDLLEAVRVKDTAAVSLKIAQLDGMQSYSIIPLHDTEKFCIYKDLKMLRALLKMLVQHYKSSYDFNRFENARYAENDGLMIYIKEYLDKHKMTPSEVDEYESVIDRSYLITAEKTELKLLMHLQFAYKDEREEGVTRNYAREFIEKFPNHPDKQWVENSILAPLNRMDVSDLYFSALTENKESVIQNKLYTGGFGLNLYVTPGVGFGFGDYYREDLVNPESYPLNFELYLQIKRVSVSFEMINTGHEGLMNLGFAIGFVAYDSRYFKIRPYLGLFGNIFNGDVKHAFYYPKEDDYGMLADESYEFQEMGTTIKVGANFDFKFGTAYLFFSDSKLVSFSLVGNVGLSYMDLSDGEPLVRGSGLDAFIAVGLGVYFW